MECAVGYDAEDEASRWKLLEGAKRRLPSWHWPHQTAGREVLEETLYAEP